MKKINGEQPIICEDEVINLTDKVDRSVKDTSASTCDDNADTNLNSDGSLGKFKNAESLQLAYENLEAEFTKKCQKLAEVNAVLESLKQDSIDVKSEQKTKADDTIVDDNAKNGNQTEKTNKDNNSLADFEQILSKVLDAKQNEKSTPTREELLQIALRDDEIRRAVLTDCLANAETNHTPYLMSKQSGNISLSATHLPNNVKEAGRLAVQLLGD